MTGLRKGPAGGTRHGQSLQSRLEDKISIGPDCWEWTGSRAGSGHGRIRVSNPGEPQKLAQAHRVVFEFTYGPIPEGQVVRHRCDNPPCCRPDHLELGTQADNVRDMFERGRNRRPNPRRGADHPTAKLTADDVQAIRAGRLQGRLLRDLAAQYGIGTSQVFRIARGTSWADPEATA